ncbi:8267_t:CDS:10 [Ambispora leptoticha]|uniref:8267_t:CDS:1 n=1 Tax=Ambispora leptoticha TaxID=144679 RepID=A0A9N9BK31_9GLOM|nr:8267_t:CDS:10 [Ambispora leptoticha]
MDSANDILMQALLYSLIPAEILGFFEISLNPGGEIILRLLDSEFCSRDYENQNDFADWILSVHALRTAIKEGKGSKDTSAKLSRQLKVGIDDEIVTTEKNMRNLRFIGDDPHAMEPLRIQPTKGGYDWWQATLSYRARLYETERDKLEDKELSSTETSEAIPMAISVKQLHTVETWLKEAREVKEGEQPLKYIKSHAVRVKKRKIKWPNTLMMHQGNLDYMRNGKQSYNPKHIIVVYFRRLILCTFREDSCKQFVVLPKLKKKLEIEFAQAVVRKFFFRVLSIKTGFNFQCHRYTPIIEGIVIDKENEEIVLEAWKAHSAQEAAKRRKRALLR